MSSRKTVRWGCGEEGEGRDKRVGRGRRRKGKEVGSRMSRKKKGRKGTGPDTFESKSPLVLGEQL